MTQQQIANHLGITRLRVNQVIGQVRDDGLVSVRLNIPLADCVELAEKLRRKFELADAMVVYSTPDYVSNQRVIGEAAASMLASNLRGHEGVGIGWGRTLSFAVRNLPNIRHDCKWVAGLMGAVTRGSGTNTIEVSTALANSLNVECHYITAPIYCPTFDSRELILSHPEITKVMQKAERASAALVACGDLSHHSPVSGLDMVAEHLTELSDLRAVGEILGCFLDAEGNVVDHPINRSILALPVDRLRDKKVTILASGGRNKLPIIRSVLLGGYVNRLVTDEVVARALLYES
ncbi:sugar-binding transcriptional regulator [Paracoccus onubensis]|uniref:Sugar-binding transcriptional regulator n=2 Tax=Paracoccus onubensis TaxID=1675788 RepID=A0A418T8V0_9RHOB|nr:sugar-binding transcriptional regulator [Paracoccus onubensis]